MLHFLLSSVFKKSRAINFFEKFKGFTIFVDYDVGEWNRVNLYRRGSCNSYCKDCIFIVNLIDIYLKFRLFSIFLDGWHIKSSNENSNYWIFPLIFLYRNFELLAKHFSTTRKVNRFWVTKKYYPLWKMMWKYQFDPQRNIGTTLYSKIQALFWP